MDLRSGSGSREPVGGDGGLDEGVGRPEQSSRCVLKADPTVGWLWVMTEKRVNMGQ